MAVANAASAGVSSWRSPDGRAVRASRREVAFLAFLPRRSAQGGSNQGIRVHAFRSPFDDGFAAMFLCGPDARP
jgi:hypothetical protein